MRAPEPLHPVAFRFTGAELTERMREYYARGVSCYRLAGWFGVSKPYAWRIVHGHRNPGASRRGKRPRQQWNKAQVQHMRLEVLKHPNETLRVLASRLHTSPKLLADMCTGAAYPEVPVSQEEFMFMKQPGYAMTWAYGVPRVLRPGRSLVARHVRARDPGRALAAP